MYATQSFSLPQLCQNHGMKALTLDLHFACQKGPAYSDTYSRCFQWIRHVIVGHQTFSDFSGLQFSLSLNLRATLLIQKR